MSEYRDAVRGRGPGPIQMRRWRAAALAVILAVGGCASAPGPTVENWASRGQDVPSMPPDDNSAAFGSYLAGQHARANGDMSAATSYFLEALAADPENLVLLQQAFSLAISDGRYKEASRLAERLSDSDAVNSLPRIFLLLRDIKNGKAEAAIKDVALIPDTGLNRLIRPLIQAWALAGAGRQDEALASLKPLSDVAAFRAFGEHHRAYLLDYFEHPEAQAAYETLLDPDRQQNLRTILAYGRYLARHGREEEVRSLIEEKAAEYLEPADLSAVAKRLTADKDDKPLHAGPVDGIAEAFYGGAAALTLDQANGPAAFYLRLALYLKPKFPPAQFLMGRILATEQQYDAALKAYAAVEDGHEFAGEARLREVWVLQTAGREREALERLFAIIDRGGPTVETVSALADMFREKSNFAEAAEHYSRALALAPEVDERHWVLYYARAIAYDQAKDWNQAEADLKKALELNPEQPDVLNYLGYSWIDRGVNMDEAETMISRAVQQRPNDGFIVDSLGWAQFKRGHYEQAVSTLERAVLLRPEDPTLNEHLGDAYWQVGRRTEARFQWSHALTLEEGEERKQELRAKLANGLRLPAAKAAQDERPDAGGAERP